MNKETNKMLIPKLRFPEFQDAKEWKGKRLEQICEVNPSIEKLPKRFVYIDLESVEDGVLLQKKIISLDGAPSRAQRLLKIGDVIFQMVRPYQKNNYFFQPLDDLDYVASTGYAQLRPHQSSMYLFQYLHHQGFVDKVLVKCTGSNYPAINSSDLSEILVEIPDFKEQQKIASCLSSIDEVITAQTHKLNALKTHKKGLMQQLFPADGETGPKLRFLEFLDKEHWKEVKLIDVTDKKTKWSFIGGPFGSNLKSSDYVSDGIRIIQLQNIGDEEFIDEYKIFTSVEKADELLSCNIYPGNIILSKMGDPVGRACLIPNMYTRYVMCSDGIRLVIDEKRFSKYFVYSLINSAQFRALVEKNASGSTRKRIGLDDLKNLPMVVPKNLKEQQKIANCLSSLDELICTQSQKLDALKVHKKGLMQQLFPVAGT